MKRFLSFMLAAAMLLALSVSASARLVGDVDSSGKVNSSDALIVLKYSVDKSFELNEKYADINGDEKVNSSDALLVLKISVGLYEGDLEVNDELVTDYKAQIIDPIMSTGKYTLTTEIDSGEKVIFAVNGDDVCIDTVTDEITLRILQLDGKKYLVVLDLISLPFVGKVSVYDEYDGDSKFNIGNSSDARYIKSEKVAVDGVEYIRETYKLANGKTNEYYFKDGKWTMLGTVTDGVTQLQNVVSLKRGVDMSVFSLDGMVETDLSSIMPK